MSIIRYVKVLPNDILLPTDEVTDDFVDWVKTVNPGLKVGYTYARFYRRPVFEEEIIL